MRSPIRQMFDQIAHRYDFLNHLLSAGRDVAWRRACCRELVAHGASQGVLLDLCGGTGDFAITYAREAGNPEIALVGDFAGGMLQYCKPKDATLVPIQLDAQNIPLPAASVAVALNGFGMRNIPDVDLALREAARVLVPGGLFMTLEFFRPTNCFTRLFYGVVAPMAIPFMGLLFSKRDAYAYLVRSIRQFLSVDEYVAKARLAGFAPVAVRACDGGIAYRVLLVKEPA